MTFEKYALEQGSIMIAFSDKNLSIGILELNPKQEMPKHNRPGTESLYQIKGKCTMKLFEDDGSVKETVLNEGESMEIPASKFHIHSNPFGEVSLTLWKFTGDITEALSKIREGRKV